MKRDIFSLSKLLESKELSSVELTRSYLDEIERKDSEIGAYLTVCAERALESAALSDKRRAEGNALGILDGIPFSLKDNFCVEGVRTTCGSKFLEEYIPPYTATAAERLFFAGAILLGKTNMDEFGMGSFTENSAFKLTKNPVNTAYSAGGSSGGSAASVASGTAVFSVGSDTGGSVRQPASHCGIVGLKPTYGRISRYGLTAFASSLDTVGVMASSAEECGLLLSVMSGKDERDASSLSLPRFLPDGKILTGLRGAIPKEIFDLPMSDGVKKALKKTVKAFESIGVPVDIISIPSLSLCAECYYIISSCEASSNLARFDGVRYGRRAKDCESLEELYKKSRAEGFGNEVKRRIMLGTLALSHGYYDDYYGRAQAHRQRICSELSAAFEKYALMIMPTALSEAPKLLEDRSLSRVYSEDICTLPASLCGMPAISLPCGISESGLPVGIQLVANRQTDGLLISAASAVSEVLL